MSRNVFVARYLHACCLQNLKLNSEIKVKKQISRDISPAKEADVGPVMYARGMTRARATSAVVAEDPSETIQHNATPPSSSLRTAPSPPSSTLLPSSLPPSPSLPQPRSCRAPNKTPPVFFSRDNYHNACSNGSLNRPHPT